LNWKA